MKATRSSENESVESWLRKRLEPEEKTVAEIVRRSLDRAGRSGRRRWGMAMSATLVLVGIVIAILWSGRQSVDPRGQRSMMITNASGEVILIEPSTEGKDASRVTIFNHGGVVAAVRDDARTKVIVVGGGS
jgi:hypothetical protein